MTTPLKLYADSHIPKAVTNQLRAKGVDIVRCQEVGMTDAKDQSHLEYAVREGRAVVTGDKDFLRLHAEWQAAGRKHEGIFYVQPAVRHLGKGAIGVMVRALAFYHEAVTGGAAMVEEDIYNQVRYITVKEWG
jgi:hypothetical protein